jgi:uncharacterized protein YkwD
MEERAIKRPTRTLLAPVLVLLGGIALGCGSTIGPHAGTGGNSAPGSGGSGTAGSGGSGQGGSGPGVAGTSGSGGRGGNAGTTGGSAAGRGGNVMAGRGGNAGSSGSAGSAGTTGAAGATGTGGASSASDVCTRWKADRADLSEGTWTGSVASCTPGDIGATARANALRVVNLYRWLAALPPVTTDPTHDAQDQACALMMRANNMISHMPPTTWTCYTADGATGASNSNVSSGPAVSSVDLYMIDPGNATTIGHRRWVLSNSLGPIGIGGTDKASCMWTLSGTGKAGKQWMAWPAAGIIPLQALSQKGGMTVDSTGWTVQSDSINLAGAQVTVTVDGTSQPVTVTQLDANYGARYAIRFNPMGWTTQAGKTYAVAVSNIPTAIDYTVQVVDCP